MKRIWMPALFSLGLSLIAHAQTPQGVRGKIVALKGDTMVLASTSGSETVKLAHGFKAYSRGPSSLMHMKANSFVGITTVDESGKATASEIHIFPASLRGLGEGSRMMGTTDKLGKPNRMTNGTVKVRTGSIKRSRMTNGKVAKVSNGVTTVVYKGGSLNIVVPKNVKVTEITPVSPSKLAAGQNVFALGSKGADGKWLIKTVMITGPMTAK